MLNKFLKQYNTKEKKMIPPNKFDRMVLILAIVGLGISIAVVVISTTKLLLMFAWLFLIASIGMICKLLDI